MRITANTRRTTLAGALLAIAALVVSLGIQTPAFAEDSGFWYGADSGGPGPSNGSAPYTMPSCGSGHAYGGYIGKIGGADLVGSSNPAGYGPGVTGAWNATDASDANDNHFNHNEGVGAGGYWFLYGPGDTRGTGDSAYNWGKQQANWAITDWQRWYANGTHRMPLRILWADVDSTTLYGWGTGNTSNNRLVFNGFFDTVAASTTNKEPGVYATAATWNTVMGNNGSIPNTWEWTAQTSVENSPSPCPTSFTGNGHSAVFYGGQTASSAHAAVWQWSIGNADYDQIDSNKNLPD
jgi:hypothetical protein